MSEWRIVHEASGTVHGYLEADNEEQALDWLSQHCAKTGESVGDYGVEEVTPVTRLLDFIIDKAEAGKIEWDDDAPVFWGMIEEIQAQGSNEE